MKICLIMIISTQISLEILSYIKMSLLFPYRVMIVTFKCRKLISYLIRHYEGLDFLLFLSQQKRA